MAYNFALASQFIDENAEKFKLILKEAVSFKSVSSIPSLRMKVIDIMKWFANKLQEEGVEVELADIGTQNFKGQKLPLPPVILGSLLTDPKKKTLCIYGHLDVQPAEISDGWDTDPFILTEKDGYMYGRGSSDDKGPVIAWLYALHTYNQLKIQFPINLKFIFEGMEENNSQGLSDLIKSRKDNFFNDVDYICISDSSWLGLNKPCLTYGIRGILCFSVTVICASQDLHSGLYGGCLNEAMNDLVQIMSSLVDTNGTIQINGIYDDVEPETEEEKSYYKDIDFSLNKFTEEKFTTISQDKTDLLMKIWRRPSLSLHGIEGAYSGPGMKTVIPGKVSGKFSIRIVPNMVLSKVEELVKSHCNKIMEKIKSKNKLIIEISSRGNYFLLDPTDSNFAAAKIAVKNVFNMEPDLTREGGSLPIDLPRIIEKSSILIPMCQSNNACHSQNEKLSVNNFIKGTKVFVDYFYQLSKIK